MTWPPGLLKGFWNEVSSLGPNMLFLKEAEFDVKITVPHISHWIGTSFSKKSNSLYHVETLDTQRALFMNRPGDSSLPWHRSCLWSCPYYKASSGYLFLLAGNPDFWNVNSLLWNPDFFSKSFSRISTRMRVVPKCLGHCIWLRGCVAGITLPC